MWRQDRVHSLLALLLVSLALPVLVSLTLAAIRPAAADSTGPLRIAFLNPGKHDEFFWPAVSAAMSAAADQFGDTLEIVYAERDAQAIGVLGREIINRKSPPDVLILVNEFQAGTALLKEADSRGIKTFMLLNSFYGQDAQSMGAPATRYRHWLGSLIPDNKAAGKRMAEALITCVREKAQKGKDGKYHLLGLLGDSTTPASIDRTAGLEEAVAARPDIVLERMLATNWQTGKGHDLTANFLDWSQKQAIPLAGIWAANDAVALGAIAAAAERQLTAGRDFCTVGLNWSPEAVDLVAKGEMVMTHGGHFLAGGWAIVMLHDLMAADATGRPAMQREATFSMAPIDQRNVQEFIAKLGDRDWRRIDFKSFSHHGKGGHYDFSLTKTLDHLRPPM
ncbi:MAG: ABC transporter substrate-binding protein [Proteobacteria bacterium]|nr:ABC transporter substrate-binding protein [Pseudomonadota bacterium]